MNDVGTHDIVMEDLVLALHTSGYSKNNPEPELISRAVQSVLMTHRDIKDVSEIKDKVQSAVSIVGKFDIQDKDALKDLIHTVDEALSFDFTYHTPMTKEIEKMLDTKSFYPMQVKDIGYSAFMHDSNVAVLTHAFKEASPDKSLALEDRADEFVKNLPEKAITAFINDEGLHRDLLSAVLIGTETDPANIRDVNKVLHGIDYALLNAPLSGWIDVKAMKDLDERDSMTEFRLKEDRVGEMPDAYTLLGGNTDGKPSDYSLYENATKIRKNIHEAALSGGNVFKNAMKGIAFTNDPRWKENVVGAYLSATGADPWNENHILSAVAAFDDEKLDRADTLHISENKRHGLREESQKINDILEANAGGSEDEKKKELDIKHDEP